MMRGDSLQLANALAEIRSLRQEIARVVESRADFARNDILELSHQLDDLVSLAMKLAQGDREGEGESIDTDVTS